MKEVPLKVAEDLDRQREDRNDRSKEGHGGNVSRDGPDQTRS